jgi:hypothetical protein
MQNAKKVGGELKKKKKKKTNARMRADNKHGGKGQPVHVENKNICGG